MGQHIEARGRIFTGEGIPGMNDTPQTPKRDTRKKGGKQLTIKQEKFAVIAVQTGNISEAYRQAYNTSNMAPETVHKLAYRLSVEPLVSQRVNEIQAQWRSERQETLCITEGKITEMLLEDRKLAYTVGQAGAAAAATMGIAKVNGLIVDRSKTDATLRHADEFTDEQIDQVIREAAGKTAH